MRDENAARQSLQQRTHAHSLVSVCLILGMAARPLFAFSLLASMNESANDACLSGGCVFSLRTTGPYSVNGVPLRRVNQKYVIATSTKVPLDGVDVSKIDDAFFARKAEKKVKGEEALFNTAKPVERLSAERKAAQEAVDAKLKANVDKIELMSAFLGARFRLSRSDKPHLMKF